MVELNGWMGIPEPYANALFARAGWDSVTIDMQHGLFDERAMVTTLQVVKAPKRFVRLAANDAALVCKVLDAGADGIIAPLIDSVGDAERLARAAYYPPRGTRSFGPNWAAVRAGGRPYVHAAEDIRVFAMIETRPGLDGVNEIAAVPGISALFIGPNDLGLALGLKPGTDRDEPEMLAAYTRVIEAARIHGKLAGIFCASPQYAARMAKFGFGFVTVISDGAALSQAALAACRQTRELCGGK